VNNQVPEVSVTAVPEEEDAVVTIDDMGRRLHRDRINFHSNYHRIRDHPKVKVRYHTERNKINVSVKHRGIRSRTIHVKVKVEGAPRRHRNRGYKKQDWISRS